MVWLSIELYYTSCIAVLDEKTALTVVENDLPDQTLDFVRQSWQDDFCPVARKLLAEIEASYSELEPL